MKAKVEVFYFGCCPYSYFLAYGGVFLDKTWARTGGEFKAELERFGVEVVEYNMLEHPELVKKLNLQIDPYNPFSNLARFLIDHKEVSKEEFFQKIRETRGEKVMKIEIKDVTSENIDDLVGPRCAPRWDDPHHAKTLKEGGLKKKEWMRKALQKLGCCAKIAYVEEKPVGFLEFYPMQVFPLLPKRQKRTILITCVFVTEKTLQNHEIGSKLVQSLVEDLRHRPLSCFNDKSAEEIAVGSWGCHTGFPESLPRFRKFWRKNGFKEDPSFPDPTGKGGILSHSL